MERERKRDSVHHWIFGFSGNMVFYPVAVDQIIVWHMKKIIVLILGIVLMSSCTAVNNTVVVKMDGWAVPANSERKGNWIDVTKYEYDGHTYLVFGRTVLTNGVVHDPDCACKETKEE